MKNKQLKTETYVDNPPIKDTTTQTTFQMRFSKSNFLFIGKWIIAFVLIVVLGSQALNGFISSKFTKDSTTETIVHEYKKQIGVEVTGGNFDFITDYESLTQIMDKKIYIKRPTLEQLVEMPLYGNNLTYTLFNYGAVVYGGADPIFRYYNSNGEIIHSFVGSKWANGDTPIVSIRYSSFKVINYLELLFYGSRAYYSFENGAITNRYDDMSYFILDSSQIYIGNSDGYNYDFIRDFMNFFFTFDNVIEKPIYETTTYTYEVKDNNYNWDLKLKQLSSFKPLFKFNQSFINEEYLKYNNLISYEYIDTSAGRELLVERYKNDERLKPLFDNNNLIIGGKTESGLFKDKTKYYSFLTFTGDLDFDNGGISSAYNWVLDNYVTDFNIDSYLEESKYKIELKDILEIFKFPIQIVNNLVYDFGVLIGFITWW